MTVPLEKDECATFVHWCRIMGVDLYHVPNENTIKNRAYIAGLKRLGWKSGISDYLVHIPGEVSKDGGFHTLFIEMKRAKKSLSRVSDNQKEFTEKMNKSGIKAWICYGADEAIEKISPYLACSSLIY